MGGEQVELTDEDDHRHLSLQFKDDAVLVGCNTVGMDRARGVMRGLAEGQVPPGP